MQRLIQWGVSGVTSNPTIFEKAISLEVSPTLAHDTEATNAEARRLFATLDRPNLMIKVPATPEGILAVRRLIGQGINVNVTLIFSLKAHRQVMEAYIDGLEELARSGGDVSKVASVASFFISRIDTAVDALLEERIRGGQREMETLLGKAAIANARLAYHSFRGTFSGERFAVLRAGGARVRRPLWASTGTKNPAYSDVLYVESLIGPDTVNTMPPATMTAFVDHGQAKATLEQDAQEAEETMKAHAEAGLSMEQVTAKLLAAGVESFADSFNKLLANIEEKQARLLAPGHVAPSVSLGPHLPQAEAALADLHQRGVVARIWQRNHTVWKPDPAEITNRLGWLTVTDLMCEQVPVVYAFVEEVRNEDFRHMVLLGMVGSSLGPEVLRQTFGTADGYPGLIVLDSTVPTAVQGVTEVVDPERTLFLVSSKSGSTIEPLAFYSYFRRLVKQAVGEKKAGQHFVAITDAGTSLESLARKDGFRRVFLNPPDIGGRYSVLSYFGLVPAALTEVDIAMLLDRADSMREGCASYVPTRDNPGAWLGAVIGTLAL